MEKINLRSHAKSTPSTPEYTHMTVIELAYDSSQSETSMFKPTLIDSVHCGILGETMRVLCVPCADLASPQPDLKPSK